jgi:hypothetical protein
VCRRLPVRARVGAALRVCAALSLSLSLSLALAATAEAQRQQPPAPRRDSAATDSVRARPAARRLPSSIPDSLLRPPITPKAAFLHSLVLPGWGQGALRRSTAATLFAVAEIGSLYMVGKSRADLRRVRQLRGLDSVTVGDPSLGQTVTRVPAVPDGLVNARKLHLEDWVAVLIFNHLIAGADAYVAANLWDLPARVSIQHTPGGVGVGAQIRW